MKKKSRHVNLCMLSAFVSVSAPSTYLYAEELMTDITWSNKNKNRTSLIMSHNGKVLGGQETINEDKFNAQNNEDKFNAQNIDETYVDNAFVSLTDKTETKIYLPGNITSLLALSFDGSVAAGASAAPGNAEGDNGVAATVWYGPNWSKQKVIGEDGSFAFSISADGRNVGGARMIDDILQAVIWSGDGWSKVSVPAHGMVDDTSLIPIGITSFSENGDVAAGQSLSSDGRQLATIWSGNEWGTATYPSKGLSSGINTLSANGSVAGGLIQKDDMLYPVIWSGKNWSDEVYLSSISGRPTNDAADAQFRLTRVSSLTADGKIAVGSSLNNNEREHATIWSGKKWSVVTDLGALGTKPDENFSIADMISADGTVIVGRSFTDSSEIHNVLWKIKSPSEVTENDNLLNNVDSIRPDSSANEQEESELSQNNDIFESDGVMQKKPEIVMIDKTNTIKTISRLSDELIDVIQLQSESLHRLSQACSTSVGNSCWALITSHRNGLDTKENGVGFTAGTTISSHLQAGITIDKSFTRSLPKSFSNTDNNLGAGAWFKWHQPIENGEWFLSPALAMNRYKANITREILPNTELAKGHSTVYGLGASLKGGQNLKTKEDLEWGWYAGLRHEKVRVGGWTENNAEFPLTWDKTNYDRTSAFAGMRTSMPLLEYLNLETDVEISNSISKNKMSTHAVNEHLGSFYNERSTKRFKWATSTGLVYQASDELRLSITPSYWSTINDKHARGISAAISGRF